MTDTRPISIDDCPTEPIGVVLRERAAVAYADCPPDPGPLSLALDEQTVARMSASARVGKRSSVPYSKPKLRGREAALLVAAAGAVAVALAASGLAARHTASSARPAAADSSSSAVVSTAPRLPAPALSSAPRPVAMQTPPVITVAGGSDSEQSQDSDQTDHGSAGNQQQTNVPSPRADSTAAIRDDSGSSVAAAAPAAPAAADGPAADAPAATTAAATRTPAQTATAQPPVSTNSSQTATQESISAPSPELPTPYDLWLALQQLLQRVLPTAPAG